MAFDESRERLFVVCRKPARLVIINTFTEQHEALLPCVEDADDIYWNEAAGQLYVIGGEGFIDVFENRDRDLKLLSRIATATGARTGLFVPEWQKLFVAVPHRGQQAAEIHMFNVKSN
jgi:hypothetical protein